MKILIYVMSLLFAVKLHAQMDSVHIYLHGYSIDAAGPTSILDRNYQNVGPGNGFYVQIPVNLDLTIPVHRSGEIYADTPGMGSSVTLLSFQIDSGQNLLRNLTIDCFPILTGPYAESNYELYVDSAGINASKDVGVDSLWIRWVGSYNGNGPQPGYYEVGGVQDSGWEKDTVSLELRLAKTSGISISSVPRCALAIGHRVATFSPECYDRHLRIFNMLGSSVCLIPVPSWASEVQLPSRLRCGYYFAWLGSQMTKFFLMN